MSGRRWYRELPWRRALIACGWALVAAVIVLSQVSLPPTGPDIPQGDKFGHVLAYATLAFWFSQISASRAVLRAHAVGFVVLGIALEGLQSLTPDRHFEVLDMLANAVGVGLGLLIGSGPRRDTLARFADALHRPR